MLPQYNFLATSSIKRVFSWTRIESLPTASGWLLPQWRSYRGSWGLLTSTTDSSEGSVLSPCPSHPYSRKGPKSYNWTPIADQAFQLLKEAFTSAPILKQPAITITTITFNFKAHVQQLNYKFHTLATNSGWNEVALLVVYRNRHYAALITRLACCDYLNNLLTFPFVWITFFWNNAEEAVCITQHLWRTQHSSIDHLHWSPHQETGDLHHMSISYTYRFYRILMKSL